MLIFDDASQSFASCFFASATASFLSRFFESTCELSPDERAVALEGSSELEEEHESVAQEGQSEVVADVNAHFICFVSRGGHLYELDGRKSSPVNHGPSDNLLADACNQVKAFMARDEGEVRFGMVALHEAGSDE